ncbi:MAG: nucleotide sugar dehydrogenase [Parcubacteria group bacterium]|nr:MAG: nucleotide sugar dehydrogenase [Parcubacteria group bacterium]
MLLSAAKMQTTNTRKICVVGLGYVGLPLAVALGQKQEVFGFDISTARISELKNNFDSRGETSAEDIKKARLVLDSDPNIIRQADFIIVAVPTPIDKNNQPDITLLLQACRLVGQNMQPGAIVVYESTVYPGCTERDCVPILAQESRLQYIKDFKVGYSPERINPGDKLHTVDKIVKIVSACDQESLKIITAVYGMIIRAGLHQAPSIIVAEAAKIIENTQRDINIALMNELKMIFDKASIDWQEVIAAASTKWNFMPFTPGLVGGHCIGVDPYYLAAEAKRLGHDPEVILSGRKINDQMAIYEAQRLLKYMQTKGVPANARLLILGGTFKPNVADTRNSKVADVIGILKKQGYQVNICEPFVNDNLFDCVNVSPEKIKDYAFVIKAVRHDIFKDIKADYEIIYN